MAGAQRTARPGGHTLHALAVCPASPSASPWPSLNAQAWGPCSAAGAQVGRGGGAGEDEAPACHSDWSRGRLLTRSAQGWSP